MEVDLSSVVDYSAIVLVRCEDGLGGQKFAGPLACQTTNIIYFIKRTLLRSRSLTLFKRLLSQSLPGHLAVLVAYIFTLSKGLCFLSRLRAFTKINILKASLGSIPEKVPIN